MVTRSARCWTPGVSMVPHLYPINTFRNRLIENCLSILPCMFLTPVVRV